MSARLADGGTSPRAWGEVRERTPRPPGLRNIPTGVGRRDRRAGRRGRRTEHPHGRGEKAPTCPEWGPADGTSPRAWGEADDPDADKDNLRNIPTGVGRSVRYGQRDGRSTEHPHGRGEKRQGRMRSLCVSGTSPRAWGEGARVRGGRRRDRNIPTGVGRSSVGKDVLAGNPEHPHGRGEKLGQDVWFIAQNGTSPRAWGEGRCPGSRGTRARNIPTGVGRRIRPFGCSAMATEHPHGRGEKWRRYRTDRRHDGTSPRAWGEVYNLGVVVCIARNIPTGVGRRVELRANCDGTPKEFEIPSPFDEV